MENIRIFGPAVYPWERFKVDLDHPKTSIFPYNRVKLIVGWLQYGLLQSRQLMSSFRETDSCRQGSLSTKCFKPGDGRLSEQPALMSLHIVFLRLHNGIATKLAAVNTHWNDEKLYQEARRIVGALIQLITYREYLPIILGEQQIQWELNSKVICIIVSVSSN